MLILVLTNCTSDSKWFCSESVQSGNLPQYDKLRNIGGFISNHYPKLYNYAFPFEFDLLSGKINEFPFERFSYDNLRRIVEGDFSNTQIFNILSVYQKDPLDEMS